MLTEAKKPPLLKIAFYRSSSIGDVVLATACLNLLEKLQLNYQAYWLGSNPSLQLISAAWPKIIPIDVKSEAKLKQDFDGKFIDKFGDLHLIVDLQKNLRSHFICSQLNKKTGAPIFSWHKKVMERSHLVLKARLRGRSQPLNKELTHKPEIFQYQLMLSCLREALKAQIPAHRLDGISQDAYPLLPTAHAQCDKPWQKELCFGHWLAIAPGAAHDTKRAPTSIFTGILNHLEKTLRAQKQGLGLVLLGDEKDRMIAKELIDSLAWPHTVLNLAGKLSLWDAALALHQCRVLLSNDSSLAHIAEAVQTPCATLFGPTIEAFGFAPHRPDSRSFSSLLGCRPCSKHGSTECRYHDKKCFTTIDTYEVAQFLAKLVKGDSSLDL